MQELLTYVQTELNETEASFSGTSRHDRIMLTKEVKIQQSELSENVRREIYELTLQLLTSVDLTATDITTYRTTMKHTHSLTQLTHSLTHSA